MAIDTAVQTFVLLKNDGTLPLNLANYKNIAVLGPQANSNTTISGDYSPIPPFVITPYQGISEYASSHGVTTTLTVGMSINVFLFIFSLMLNIIRM